MHNASGDKNDLYLQILFDCYLYLITKKDKMLISFSRLKQQNEIR